VESARKLERQAAHTYLDQGFGIGQLLGLGILFHEGGAEVEPFATKRLLSGAYAEAVWRQMIVSDRTEGSLVFSWYFGE